MIMKNIFLTFTLSIFICSLYGQGLILDQEAYDDMEKYDPSEEMGFASASTPSKISFRKHTPSVGYQGELSTCVGWAVAYAQLTTQQNAMMGITNFYQRTARAMDPHFLYAFIRNSNDKWCQNGTLMSDALYVLQNVGCKPYYAEPWFSCNSAIKKDDVSLLLAQPYMIKEYKPININVESVKYLLSKGLIVSAGFNTNNSFVSQSTVSTGKWTLSGVLDANSGHAMCIIGYDDYKYGGAFEIMNSYSNKFGDNGFVWISYSDFLKTANQAWIMNTPGFNDTGSCLFGNCETAYSIFKGSDGGYYEGIVENGYPSIYGTRYYTNGTFYIGGWKNGYENGTGLFYSADKGKYFRVTMKMGRMESGEAMGFASAEEEQKIESLFEEMNARIPGEMVDPDSEEYEEFYNNYKSPEGPLKAGEKK